MLTVPGFESLPAWLRGIFLAVTALIGCIFVLGPLILWLQHRIERNFHLTFVAAEQLPPAALALAEAERPAFEKAGFQGLGYCHFQGYTAGIEAWFCLYRHTSEAGLVAMTAAIYQLTGVAEPTQVLGYNEISALFADGFNLCINNSGQMGAFESKHKLVLRYPGLPVADLMQHFQQVQKHHPRCQKYASLAAGQELGRIRQQMLKELDDQVEEGLYRLDTANNQYRLTVTGAIVLAMRHLPPFSHWRKFQDRQQAKKWDTVKG